MSGVNSASPTLQLRDGRILGYAEYGSPTGKTLFYFHGHPGSRLEARFLAEQARQSGIRLIGIDRPGMGLSTFKSDRRPVDWPDDLIELADHLQIDRFSVVGFSGGGPYALACAYRIPNRLTTCGVVSSVGRMSPFLSFLSQWVPWVFLPVSRRFFQNETNAQKILARFAGNWPEPDRQCLMQPDVKELMAASLVEGLRQGARGAAYEGALLGRFWGYKLEAITLPSVYLWHGELDNQVAVATVRPLATTIPHCKATYYPNDAHISTIINHHEEIVTTLMTTSSSVQGANP